MPPPTSHRPWVTRHARNNWPLALGSAAVLATGYYLFRAGGDPKGAMKAAERDASSYTSRLKREFPDASKEGRHIAEEVLGDLGSSVDRTVQEGKHRINEASQKLEKTAEEIRRPVLRGIDEADRRVEMEASKARSGVASWFGFGGK